jgi:hypothetical protein
MVERSLLAAERSVWVAGMVVGGVVVRREVVWPVSVVVAVDMGTWDLLGGGEWGGPAAREGDGTIGKRLVFTRKLKLFSQINRPTISFWPVFKAETLSSL